MFIFGLALPARAGLAVSVLSTLCFFIGSFGILKLKPWGYSLIIGLQLFWLASAATNFLNPNYNAAMSSFMKDVEAWMHMPESESSPENFMSFGWFMKLGLVFGFVILGILIYYRPRFLAAATAAKASPERRVTL
jgi:hypothetical protein